MSKNQFVASQLILVFRPEIDFWHAHKSICGLIINFGISSRIDSFGMSKNQFVASQLILVFRPEVHFEHVQKSIRGLKID